MSDFLTSFIQEVYSLPAMVLEEVLAKFQFSELPKNYVLLKQGNICKNLWIVKEGVVRHYYEDKDGKDHNVWFVCEGSLVTETDSFMRQRPSYENIQLLEDSALYGILQSDYYDLIYRYHSFAIWSLKLFEKYYVKQIEDRIGDLQFLSAKERYDKLLLDFPNINNRISLGHIASYLNITQETLSRIRAKK